METDRRVRFLRRVDVWSIAAPLADAMSDIPAKISRTPTFDCIYHTTSYGQHILGVNGLDFLGQTLQTRFDAGTTGNFL